MTFVKSPAPYTPAIQDAIVALFDRNRGRWSDGPPPVDPPVIYDPMAGNCRIAAIADRLGIGWAGSELEGEFVPPEFRYSAGNLGGQVRIGDCRQTLRQFVLVCTSPGYGNRFADQYLGTPAERAVRAETGQAPRRRGYAVALGRRTSPGNGGGVQWGRKYKALHEDIWRFVVNVTLEPRGLLCVNVGSHFRGLTYRPVAEWHLETIIGLGCDLVDYAWVATPGFRDGENRDARAGGEHVYLFQKR